MSDDSHPEDLQSILNQAETAWQNGETNFAIDCYNKALQITREQRDIQREGEILLGKGFALMSLQRFDDAISIFHSSKNIATSCGYVAQAQFVDGLISEAQSKAQSGIRSNSIQQLSLESRDDDHIQRTFARSFVEKELIVLVLNDQKETSDNAFSTEIMKALKSLSIACEFLNVRNNESLINAFKKEFDCPSLPMLFVAGKLLGGREDVVELSRKGRLKEVITSALPETISEEAKKQLFAAIDHCETSETCNSKHKERLLRMVLHVSQKVCAISHPPSRDEDLHRYFETRRDIPSESIVSSFIKEISQLLGNFPLPCNLLKEAATPIAVVDYIEANCPAQGDCRKLHLFQLLI
mmetsp:Transcript_47786/g.149779  ORF Transcript_47786/g.149779 Transcript_47786/m.149779 type:complete len:354 (-) Transcript_47786:770-1831(-)